MNTPYVFSLKTAVLAIAACFATQMAGAAGNPTGAAVVNGTVTFANQGNTLLITNTPGAVINWQQFNIGKGFTTQFVQQSAQSSVLNRVVSNQPSQIFGTLRSNGQVYLVNQAGILFGAGAVIDVHGLIASTLNISNMDFLLNRLRFNDGQGASVVNQGKITTPMGGRVYLIGETVKNEGVITTPQGQVVLAAGKSATLVDTATPNVSVTLQAGGQAVNLGRIQAQGGSIDVYAALIEQQGLLRANSAQRDPQGNIVLSATQSVNLAQGSTTEANGVNGGKITVRSAGTTTVAGQVNATGTTGRGGEISLLGEQVSLTDSAQIDASGDTGGGTALIGGDFQGKNAAVQNATHTQIAQGATVRVDARVKGNGGKAVVWANDHTDYFGSIYARGGSRGGNGGNVEVSGKKSIVFKGTVNTLAPKGKAGSLLLDPTSVCVLTGASVDPRCASVLAPLDIANAFWMNGNFVVKATGGDVLLIDYIDLTRTDGISNTGKVLTFQAINGNIQSLSETAAVAWKTGMGGTTLGGQIFSAGADVLFNATGSTANNTGGVHLNNSMSTQGGNVKIAALGKVSIDGGGTLFRIVGANGVTNSYPSGIYTSGGSVSVVAEDFALGFDSRYAALATADLITPAVINTVFGGAGTTGADGSVNINTVLGGAGTGIWIKNDSAIQSGRGNVSLVTKPIPVVPPPAPPPPAPETVACTLNPTLCSNTGNNPVLNPVTKSTPPTTAIVRGPAPPDVTYHANLGAAGQSIWVTYSDVRRARQETRQADEKMELGQGGDALPLQRETQMALVSVKRAESRVRETEMELRAADAEVRAATSPEARQRAEVRQAIAATRRADAEVKRADAEIREAEVEAKNAATPAARVAAESKKSAMEVRKVHAEVTRAEAEVEKARSETAQLENGGADKTAVAVKRADIDVKKADVAVKRAEMDSKTAKDPAAREQAAVKVVVAQAQKANAQAQKAVIEAQRAEEEARVADTPSAHRVAETKKAEAEVARADAEVKQTRVELKTAKDPEARSHAENKMAQAEVKRAEAEVGAAEAREKSQDSPVAKSVVVVKRAELAEKQAEVALKTEKDALKKSEAEVKLADARVQRVDAEEKQAVQEVNAVREAVKTVRSESSKQVLMKKAEASEAKVVAKHSESDAKKAELAVKRVESEMKQIEAEAKEAKSPEQRRVAEQRLGAKRDELDNKRAESTQKTREADALRGAAHQKDREYHAEKDHHDERIIESFGGMALAEMDKGRVQAMMAARHDFLKEKLGSALKVLSANPKAANLRTCDSKDTQGCLRPAASMANVIGDVIARIKMPRMSPITSFLPEIQRKVAVVIGNNAYQDPDIPSLNGAARDADAVGTMLKEKMGYEVRMVHNGSRADIVRTLNQVADETGSKDSVVVYYAGHGYQMEDTKEGYWIPSDASTTSPENWISNADINNMLMAIPAKQMMVVSDSCFSGSLTQEQQVSSAATATQTPAVILGKRSVLVMSSGGEEPVMDEGRDGHSVFAWHLMDKLNQLNSYEHGAEVFDAIKAGVAQDGIPQTPQYGASVSAGHSTGGDYLFEVRHY